MRIKFWEKQFQETFMKLFLVHCGFYDMELCEGIYESHVNLFVVASNFEDAKIRVRENLEFKERKMHVDGLQEVALVSGFNIDLIPNPSYPNETKLISNRHRDL
jgi:hypothetical protein